MNRSTSKADRWNRNVVLLLLALVVGTVGAVMVFNAVATLQAHTNPEVGTANASPADAVQAIKPNATIDAVEPLPQPAGAHAVIANGRAYFVSPDNRYVSAGSYVNTTTRRDVLADAFDGYRKRALEALSTEDTIVYRPANPRYEVTVFTDIDCPYCQRMQASIDEYLAKGIAVRYVLFPRSGVNSAGYQKAVDVWCAEERMATFAAAMAGQRPDSRTCKNPVKAGFELGHKIGVYGTPTIISSDGRMMGGFLSAQTLLLRLTAQARS
jgi:thiol:disulfide interchange protein DsbC